MYALVFIAIKHVSMAFLLRALFIRTPGYYCHDAMSSWYPYYPDSTVKVNFYISFLKSNSVLFDTKPSISTVFSHQIRNRMSRTLSEIRMDNIGTVRETAHALSMLSAVPGECDTETQVPIDLTMDNRKTSLSIIHDLISSIFYQI